MTPVDIYSLNGLPAPYWFIQLFKVLGFILHSVPMHLWLAGLPLALVLLLIGGGNGKTFARRLLKQMPVVMAFGINLGIVPLLFIQVAYYKVFYPATILMAWHWIGILVLVLPAYYLLYITSGLVDRGFKWRPAFSGAGASLLLIGAGLIFASAWSLMASPESWPELWRAKSLAAAATGLGTNWNPVVLLRFISICGLAILTVTFWVLFDAHFLYVPKKDSGSGRQQQQQISDFMENPYLSRSRKKELSKLRDRGKLTEEEELEALTYGFNDDDEAGAEGYPRWTLRFASVLVWFGVCITLGSLWLYYYKVIDGPESVTSVPEASMVNAPARFAAPSAAPERMIPVWIPPVTFTAVGLFAAVIILANLGKVGGKLFVALLGLCLAAALTFFAITRQIIQNEQIKNYLDVRSIPEQMQLSPLLVFLLVFLFGAGLIFWMVAAMAKTAKR
ncbi:MAG: hypothetical protein IJG60_01845 [Thermoguttaceae bacterium]|nr:hypothetical protein [Thermoguttaceae bacterium]